MLSYQVKIQDISRRYYPSAASANVGLDLLYDKIGSSVRILQSIQAGNPMLSTVKQERKRRVIILWTNVALKSHNFGTRINKTKKNKINKQTKKKKKEREKELYLHTIIAIVLITFN